MKNFILVGLVCGLSGIAFNTIAYVHTIINTTEYHARVHFGYVGCKDDYREVDANKTVNNDGKGCILGGISATVLVVGLPPSVVTFLNSIKTHSIDTVALVAMMQPKSVGTTFNYDGPYTGSSTWILYGNPVYGFGITRKVN